MHPQGLLEGDTTTSHLSVSLPACILTQGWQDTDRWMKYESPQRLAGEGGNQAQWHPVSTNYMVVQVKSTTK